MRDAIADRLLAQAAHTVALPVAVLAWALAVWVALLAGRQLHEASHPLPAAHGAVEVRR